MLLPVVVTFIALMAPITYVALRKFSVVEQEIAFDEPQGGVAGLTLVIRDDAVQRLRIAFDDGRVCEVFPSAQDSSHGCVGHSPHGLSRDGDLSSIDSRLSVAAGRGPGRLSMGQA